MKEKPVLSPVLYDCPRENFPADMERPEGVHVLQADFSHPQVRYHSNVPYLCRSGIELHLQILQPECDTPLPLIVYVQGSAWRKQNVYYEIPQLVSVARMGYVVAVVEYRPSDIARFPAQMQDAKTAIRYLKSHAGQYGVDPQRVAVWGDSSGGHTALMVGVTQDMPELDTPDYGEVSCEVCCVVDMYGPTRIDRMNDVPSTQNHNNDDSPESDLIGAPVGEHPELAARTSPMTYLTAERALPPILMLHGTRDRLVPFQQSVLLYEALRALGKQVEFYCLEDADHGGSPFWTQEVLRVIDAFIRKSWQK
ncbi:MAG: alpha/beta hydrolase [Eubacteriales bacterium]|nr:alpha/beta hydrolase [Eubacteriales bacterium]